MRITLTLGGNTAVSQRQDADSLIAAAAGGVADATAFLEQTLRGQPARVFEIVALSQTIDIVEDSGCDEGSPFTKSRE